ncbi:MAG: AarF/ABC1/UbiB kinase family protein, partial [Myxococcales bacterium]|nr:AarF/ABC1/UbiB kinase family protein [Myxococcales bacterium]
MGKNDGDDDLDGIRSGWGKRLWSTSKVAGNALRLAARGVRGAKPSETDNAIGESLARELDSMKGLAMKVGQILSYFDGVLPEGTHAALRPLQQGARAVAFDTMGAVVEAELGAPVGELFEAFDTTPVASASIGQVYRAKLDGADVAVKVQYPEVARTLAADAKRLRGLSRLASVATAVDGPALVDELAARLGEECDYEREAEHLRRFRAAFAHVPEAHVPAPVAARTSARVLTTEWCPGASFYEFEAAAPQARKDEVGLLLARFAYESLYRRAALNADPHPGNYLFPDDGPVVFLDFGCVRYFEADFLAAERALTRCVIDDRKDRFRDALLATGMVAKPKGFDFDSHWALLRHQLAPYSAPRFRFDFEYIRGGVGMTGPSNPNLRKLAIPPAWIWLQRQQWG